MSIITFAISSIIHIINIYLKNDVLILLILFFLLFRKTRKVHRQKKALIDYSLKFLSLLKTSRCLMNENHMQLNAFSIFQVKIIKAFLAPYDQFLKTVDICMKRSL